jgi:sulfur-carrier protein
VATVFLKLPAGLVDREGPPQLECRGSTLREALDDCVAKEPRLTPRLFRDDGALWVGLFINGRNARALGGLDAPLADGDVIKLMPPISGG